MPSPRTVLRGMIASYLAVVAGGVVMLVDSAGRTEAASSVPRRAALVPVRPPGPVPGVTRRLSAQTALYPRAIRLAHSGASNGRIIASVVSHSDGNGTGEIYESTDDGAGFTHVGTIADPQAANGRGLCCGSLFEVPRAAGRTPEGTLLWAASTGQSAPDRRMALRVWQSADHGRSWSYLSSCATARNNGGLWEPELSMDATGRLVCHFSDETQPAYSQTLARTLSADGGRTWTTWTNTVVGRNRGERPGMPVVRKLPYGIYVMAYEVCAGPGAHKCAVHLRSSTDGWNWNGPDLLPRTGEQTHFEHAPTIAWAPAPGMFGRLVLVGQFLAATNGVAAYGSGRMLLTNDQRGVGPWTQIPAPLMTPPPFQDSCANYSSALLPSADGTRLLEIGTQRERDGVCRAYYSTGPLR